MVTTPEKATRPFGCLAGKCQAIQSRTMPVARNPGPRRSVKTTAANSGWAMAIAPAARSRSLPADLIAIMRKAFDDTMKDPGFLAQMNKEWLPVHPVTGQEADQIISKIMMASPTIIAKAKEIYQ